MLFKTKLCQIEIEMIFIFVILTSIISNTLFKFLYYFFACYLFILFHELMHILVGNLLNKKLIKIKFSISGVCACFEKEKYKQDNINYFKNVIIYISGPFSNLILAYIFNNNTMIREINIFLALLNLLPIFPLDGYNILLNTLRIAFKNINFKKCTNAIGNVAIIILLIIATYQIKEYYNFSILMFSVYLFVLKNSKKS